MFRFRKAALLLGLAFILAGLVAQPAVAEVYDLSSNCEYISNPSGAKTVRACAVVQMEDNRLNPGARGTVYFAETSGNAGKVQFDYIRSWWQKDGGSWTNRAENTGGTIDFSLSVPEGAQRNTAWKDYLFWDRVHTEVRWRVYWNASGWSSWQSFNSYDVSFV